MSEAGEAALAKIAQGIVEYVATFRDEGDAETLVSAVVMFETGGITADGQRFARQSYFTPEDYLVTPAQLVGLVEINRHKILESFT